MLIKLTSSTSGEVVMFARHARHLFEIIGKERTARGVFTLEQLPAALVCLHQAVDEEKLAARLRAEEERSGKKLPPDDERDADGEDGSGDDDDEHAAERKVREHVSLAQRARPLINLMEWTIKEKGFILWEAAQDF